MRRVLFSFDDCAYQCSSLAISASFLPAKLHWNIFISHFAIVHESLDSLTPEKQVFKDEVQLRFIFLRNVNIWIFAPKMIFSASQIFQFTKTILQWLAQFQIWKKERLKTLFFNWIFQTFLRLFNEIQDFFMSDINKSSLLFFILFNLIFATRIFAQNSNQ